MAKFSQNVLGVPVTLDSDLAWFEAYAGTSVEAPVLSKTYADTVIYLVNSATPPDAQTIADLVSLRAYDVKKIVPVDLDMRMRQTGGNLPHYKAVITDATLSPLTPQMRKYIESHLVAAHL